MHLMDGLFSLPEAARADFLRSLVQSFGCTYVCLWQYDTNYLPNRLFFLDGFYGAMNNESSSSLGSAAECLFRQYQTLTFDVNDGCVPGFAFRNHLPYLELQQSDLLRLTMAEIQTQFFQEARIENAVFMGCKKGEIELGFSKKISQDDIQTAIRNLFSEEFFIVQSQSSNQNIPHSSSPSSSPSVPLSTGSPNQCSPLLPNNIPHSHFSGTLPSSQTSPHQLAQVIPSYFPAPEGEHEAIVSALFQVISSTSQQHQPHQNLPNYASAIDQEDTAFKRYRAEISTPLMGSNFQRQSLQNRSVAFFKNLDSMKMSKGDIIQASRPSSSQQQNHMLTERKRREKLNQSFQALRALLPPGTKESKVSILTTAKERVRSLMDEIEKLNIRNQQLMMNVLSAKEATSTEQNKGRLSNYERLNVHVSHVLESSSSEERIVDLQVAVRGESPQIEVLMIRLLEFLERVQNVNLISMAANNHISGGTPINTHQLIFRLRVVEDTEWDERVFQEAVRRVVADVLQCQLDQ